MLVSEFQFNGYRLFENSLLLKDGEPYEVNRTLKERWFSLPWRPLKKNKTIVPKVPSDEMVIDRINKHLYMHPETLKQFKLLLPTVGEQVPEDVE